MTSRREFLKKTAVAGAAIALSPSSITGRDTRAHAPGHFNVLFTHDVVLQKFT